MRSLTPGLFYIHSEERSLSGDLGVASDSQNGSVPGDDQFHSNGGASLTLRPIDPYEVSPHWLDIFSQGVNTITWTLTAEPFVTLTQTSGTVSPKKNSDQRVYITIDWSKVPSNQGTTRINITSSTDYGTQYPSPYLLLPYNRTSAPSSFTGFVESDLTVSIEASHYTQQISSSSDLTYYTIPHYGKTSSATAISLSTSSTPSTLTTSTAPSLEYAFYTFSTLSKPANISLVLGQSLNANPKRPLRYAIAVDDQPPQTVQYIIDQTGGNTPKGWEKAVADAAWVSTTNATLAPGEHVLRFWALEPAVILQKIVIDMGGVKASYLGPPESRRV